ncbi:MAG: hypothetical protein RL095_1013 [Verrucomicrobiota bacterium]|jgi:cyclic pyranopterin phosphate synthase
MSQPAFSHTDEAGKVSMVDVSAKSPQVRTARASGHISLLPATLALLRDNGLKKGDVLASARIAGILAAKRTAELIPLCHPLLIDRVHVVAEADETGVAVSAEVRCTGRTGVEIEALTAVSVALLTVYDMCKAADKQMVISDIKLLEKTKEPVVAI